MRKALLNVEYNGTDISEDISDRLISFSYNDNKQGEADDIEITVHNRDGLWTSDWYPDKGSKLKAGLKLIDWEKEGDKRDAANKSASFTEHGASAEHNLSVNFGVFSIDELSVSSGGTFTIKAIASICEKAFKNEKRYKTWENVTMREVISSIASDNGLQLVWKAGEGTTYPCIYQIEQTDAAFIMEKANLDGLKIKISEEKLIIYEDSIGDSGLTFKPSDLSGYSFKSKTFGIYDSCAVSFLDPMTNKKSYSVYVDPKQPKTKCLQLDMQAKDSDDAMKKAKAALKSHNEREITGSIDLIGNPKIWSGEELTIKDFGVFDGVYVIESVKHSIDRGGYKTSADLIIKK